MRARLPSTPPPGSRANLSAKPPAYISCALQNFPYQETAQCSPARSFHTRFWPTLSLDLLSAKVNGTSLAIHSTSKHSAFLVPRSKTPLWLIPPPAAFVCDFAAHPLHFLHHLQ